MRPETIHFVFAGEYGRGSGTRTHGSGFGDRQCSRFAYSPISKSNEKPGTWPGPVLRHNALRPSTHAPPNDPLGHSGYHVFEDLTHWDRATLRKVNTAYRTFLRFATMERRGRFELPYGHYTRRFVACCLIR